MPTPLGPYLIPVLILLCSLSFGRVLLRSLRVRFQNPGEAFFLTGLTGVGALGTILLVFGILGFFTTTVLWTLLLGGSLFGALNLIGSIRSEKGRLHFRKGDLFAWALMLCASGVLGITALTLNIPATTADELSYHLYLPKLFLMKGSVFYSRFHVNSVFPLLTEMLYSYGVSLKSALAAKAVHFLFGLWLALGTYWLGRSLSIARRTATTASVLLLSLPVVNHQMGLAHTDLALGAFLTGSYATIFRWNSERRGHWLILAGILSGFAMNVKYLALFAMIIQLAVIITKTAKSRQPVKEGARSLLLFVCSAAIVCSFTYLRSYWFTGNPFYPYLTTILGGRGLENPLHLAEKGFGTDWLSLLQLPWKATFHTEAFGGLGNQWGPIFLGFLPGILFLRRKAKEWRYVLVVSLLSLLFWFYSKQNLRFLIPAAPFFCLIVSAVLEEARARGGRVKFLTSVVFCAYLAIHLGVAGFRLMDSLRVATGLEKKEQYLSRTEASFDIARFLNASAGGEVKVLSQEHRAYYFEGEVVRERAYRRLTEYDNRYAGRETDFYMQLRREGFTHILILLMNGAQPVEFWNRLMTEAGKGDTVPKKLRETIFYDSVTREKKTYLLYQL